MDRRLIVVGAVLGVVGLVAGFALAWAGDDDGEARTITVTATGKAEVVPDVAEVSLGASATAPTAAAARTAADAAVARVIALLEARGIEGADIQTSQVTVSPNYDPETGATVSGYTATNTVTATIRDLDATGEILAAATDRGANLVGGPTLTSSRQEELYEEALAAALPAARAKAEALAVASDAELGGIVSVTEAGGYSPFATEGKADASTPIEPGILEIEAQITVVYDLEV